MESWKLRITNNNQRPYGRYKVNAPCRKHPKHVQSPGVCSICLNDKLSHLTNHSSSSRRKPPASPSSSSSSYLSSLTSSDASSCSSPVQKRVGTRARKPVEGEGEHGLKKSRSMAFFLQRKRDEGGSGKIKVEIKRGFWSKLLPVRKSNKGLMRSTSMRERFVEAVH